MDKITKAGNKQFVDRFHLVHKTSYVFMGSFFKGNALTRDFKLAAVLKELPK